MIISSNSDPNREEFDSLIKSTLLTLNSKAKSSKKVATLLGRRFEPFVKDVMTDLAVGTPFENTIELIGGQKFPDIVARKYYGIEVKTTTQDHWKTTGNSVLESTRVENVERIFMLFAKLASPIEFRCRPYEEVLSEVVVTHSPRYLIDMNLKKGETIFDKINLPYDKLRNEENPIKPIINYYKSRLNPGEQIWWMDGDSSYKPSNIVIRIWNNLNDDEKIVIKNKAMIFFPELFSNSSNKFSRLAIWLATQEAVVCPNVRDLFTAGGRNFYSLGPKTYKNVPRIFLNLFENSYRVLDILLMTSADELGEYWGVKTSNKSKVQDWINLVGLHSESIRDVSSLNVKEILRQLLLK